MREGTEGYHHQEENEGKRREQDGESDLVGSLLPLGTFDEPDHAIHEALARISRDEHHQAIGKHRSAASDGAAIASRFSNHRRRFSGDGRFVHGGCTFDHFAIGGNRLPRLHDHPIPFAQELGRHRLLATVLEASRQYAASRGTQGIRLGLAAPFGHGLGEVGEKHREPEPGGDLDREGERRPAGGQESDVQSGKQGSHRGGEHHRIAPQRGGLQFDKTLPQRRHHDGAIEQRAICGLHEMPFRTGCSNRP